MRLLDYALTAAPLVFLDLETTGLDFEAGARICEVGAVRLEAGREVARLSRLVNPERPLDPEAAAVNGLDEAQLAAAPRFATLAPELEAVLSGALMIAHNAAFDLAFLQREWARSGAFPATAPIVLDSLGLARRLLRRSSYSLQALCRDFGIAPPTHRALDDALCLRELFAQFLPLLAAAGISSVSEALRYERGLLPNDPEPEPPAPIASALAAGQLLRITYSSLSLPEPTARIIRPIELTRENSGLFLRAYCYLRRDFRAFALQKISAIEVIES